MALNRRMTVNELERMWKKASVACLRYCSSIFLDGLRGKNEIHQVSKPLDLEFKLGPPIHEARMLFTALQCFV
jgi:hypothetical protein